MPLGCRMKRADLLFSADVPIGRFKVLKQRGQLPFEESLQSDKGHAADFTLDDAFRLRLMMDLIGGEEGEETLMSGLGPTYSLTVISDAMRAFPRHPLNQIEPEDWWTGVVVFEDRNADGSLRRWSKSYAGELSQFPAWIQQERQRPLARDGSPRGRYQVVRVFAANATRAADFVRGRAALRGLPEGSDFSEIAKDTE